MSLSLDHALDWASTRKHGVLVTLRQMLRLRPETAVGQING